MIIQLIQLKHNESLFVKWKMGKFRIKRNAGYPVPIPKAFGTGSGLRLLGFMMIFEDFWSE